MSFGEAWKNAERNEFEPDKGTHQVRIDSGSTFTSKAGDDCAKIILEITEGKDAGQKFEHFMFFGHEVSAAISREALLAYGLEDPAGVNTLEDLDDRIQKLIGRTAEVGVSYKDGRMNLRPTGSRAAEDQAPDVSGRQQPAADFASAASSNGGDDEPLPF